MTQATVTVTNGGQTFNDVLYAVVNNAAGTPALQIRYGASIRIVRISDGQELQRAGSLAQAAVQATAIVNAGWV